jgi:serine/threonine-protein kinase
MAALAAERNLLFGLLALQNGLINQVQLVSAFQAWTLDKARALADHLVGRGDLDADDRSAVDALVARHLKKHGGDVERSLAAIPAGRSTRESLAGINDPDVGGTLAYLGSVSTQHGDDDDRTASYAVGEATSDGQRFRVLRPHARGGLGAVFVALDEELHREVALKQILDQHADDPISRQRFLLEAEITGGLEHPGIVPVYGLGTYGDGRPYYAMRFIRGDSLKEAIVRFHAEATRKQGPGRRSLVLHKLLRRFLDVCNAVDYAHSRGVLHRDIKPGNIIVGRHGETLVVDWGLAKATGESAESTEERALRPSSASGSSETLPGSALGTPAYMSPEQARGELDRLGPSSDVYSLGATLYCLLTGRPPLEGDVGEVLRRAQAGDFPPPRAADPAIDRALEAVCLKAMAPDPGGRYASCKALAEDVERWLADEPVSAWREPLARRAGRWARRHRTAVTAAAVAVVAGAVGLAGVLAVQTKANAELTRSKAAVQARYDLAVEAIQTFHTGVSEDFLLKQHQFKALRDRLLNSAADFYERLGTLLEGESDEASRRALLQANFEVAELANKVGRKGDALTMHQKVLSGREALARQSVGDAGPAVDVARSLVAMGELLESTGKSAEALAAYERASAAVSGPRGAEPTDPSARLVLAESEGDRGWLLQSLGKSSEGLKALERARSLCDSLAQADPGNHKLELQQALNESSIGITLFRIGRLEPAQTSYKKALAIRQKLFDSDPAATNYQIPLAASHKRLADFLARTEKPSEAVVEYRKALEIDEKLADDNPAVTSFLTELVIIHNGLGEALSALGKQFQGEAEAEFHKALAIGEKIAQDNPRVTDFRFNIIRSSQRLGWLYSKSGRMAEAEKAERKMVEIFEKLASDNPAILELQLELADVRMYAGQRLPSLGRVIEAEAEFRQAITLVQMLVDGSPSSAQYRHHLAGGQMVLGRLLASTGRLSEAEAEFRPALAIRQKLAEDYPDVFWVGTTPDYRKEMAVQYQREVADSLGALASLLTEGGRFAEASEYYSKEAALRQKIVDVTSSDAVVSREGVEYYREMDRDDLANCQTNTANVLRKMGKLAEARAACDTALTLRERLVKAFLKSWPENPRYRERLAESYLRSGQVLSDLGDPRSSVFAWRHAIELYDEVTSSEPSHMFLLACCHASLAGLAGRPDSGVPAEEGPTESDRAMHWLHRAAAVGYRSPATYRAETALDPLRDLDDFRLLLLDLAFPADPFASTP